MPMENGADPPRGDPDIDRTVHAVDLLLHSLMICATAVLKFTGTIGYSVVCFVCICIRQIHNKK